jgi:hypothetical protein
MSDDHRAVVPTVNLPRSEAIQRVATRLRDHGLVFDEDARGLHWDEELSSFSYDNEDDHDLEGLDSIDTAIAVSQTWERVCLDFRGMSSTWELHASVGTTSVECHVALIFPHSLYRLSASDIASARRLIHLLDGIREVLGAEQLVCGTETPERGLSMRELSNFIDAQIQAHRGPTPRMHTLVIEGSSYDALCRRHRIEASWHRLDISADVRAISQLPIDE